jgi:hypothetical protein
MKQMGTIRDGKILLDATPLLPDGTRVVVGFKPVIDPDTFKLTDLKDLQEGWLESYPGEFEDLERMVQEDREADVALQIEREKAESH